MNTIADIKQQYNIRSLAESFGMKVNRSGFISSIYKKERTPSLKIYEKENRYFCFATGKGGDVISFFADYHKISLNEAILRMSGRNQPKAPRYVMYQKKDNSNADTPYILLSRDEQYIFDERIGIRMNDGGLTEPEAEMLVWTEILEDRRSIQREVFAEFYWFVHQYPMAEEARNYLMGPERNLEERTIQHFGVTHIINVSHVIQFLKETFSRVKLDISGLFKNDYFIFQEHPLIIPYYKGKDIVYLRGRTLKNNPAMGKYTAVHNESTTLSAKRFYNSNVLTELYEPTKLIITEGEFDCMIAWQNGYHALGVPGVGNLPYDQLKHLEEFDLFFAFDNDIAGNKAIQTLAQKTGKDIKSINIKNSKDITEMAVHGR